MGDGRLSHACFHLVRDKEFSGRSGLAFSLVCSSLSSGSIQRIFLKSPQKTPLGFMDIIKPNCHTEPHPLYQSSGHTPAARACFCLRYRSGSPEIIPANLNTISLLAENSVRPHNRGFP